jgi:hypothetical protein
VALAALADLMASCSRKYCKRPARVGGKYCAECRERVNAASRKSQKRRRAQLRAIFRCVEGCGRRTDGGVRCAICADKLVDIRRDARRRERSADGVDPTVIIENVHNELLALAHGTDTADALE